MLELNKDNTSGKVQASMMWCGYACFAACIAVHSRVLLGRQVYVFCPARCAELNQRGPNRLNWCEAHAGIKSIPPGLQYAPTPKSCIQGWADFQWVMPTVERNSEHLLFLTVMLFKKPNPSNASFN